jgi:disulfide bond formation protein DsbB
MQNPQLAKPILYFAWIQALIAMLGSLYFSEILHFPPCVLCWYQRIAMYPLVLILPIGILARDKKVSIYALPLALAGLGIAFYHSLLYYQILPESLAPCVQGISCTTKYIEWFGFITIPLLSLVSFLTLVIGLIWHHKLTNQVTKSD